MLVRFLGQQIPYDFGMQEMRNAIACIENLGDEQLLLLEHKDTITTTRSKGLTHLLKPAEQIRNSGIDIIETDRGGDVTFHGLGQLVGYPILRIAEISEQRYDLIGYVRTLERALLNTIRKIGIECYPIEGKTGVWVKGDNTDLKLIAIGVGVSSKGVTRHGFALNVWTNLPKFTEVITPCGLADKGVTSLTTECAKRGIALPTVPKLCVALTNEIGQAFNRAIFYENGFQPALTRKVNSRIHTQNGAIHG